MKSEISAFPTTFQKRSHLCHFDIAYRFARYENASGAPSGYIKIRRATFINNARYFMNNILQEREMGGIAGSGHLRNNEIALPHCDFFWLSINYPPPPHVPSTHPNLAFPRQEYIRPTDGFISQTRAAEKNYWHESSAVYREPDFYLSNTHESITIHYFRRFMVSI